MKILLSDGSGLTSRQVATILGNAGHTVEVLDSAGLSLTHFTRWVNRVHRVPPFGADPFAWLDAACVVLRDGGHDVLLPTQEQVAMLALRPGQIPAALAVPGFAALRRVQDKLSAAATLAELDLPQPPSVVARNRDTMMSTPDLPVFVKVPIGTASLGVRRVADPTALRALADELHATGGFADGGVLVQRAVTGPLLMVQAVFDRGRLVAWHACRRVREGTNGGASGKSSDPRPEIATHLARLGTGLGWHGALSGDAILTDAGPVYIDLNPRIVEPVNALRAGVDLVGAMLAVSCGEDPAPQPWPKAGVRTHQLVLALAAAAGRGRRSVLRELLQVGTRTGAYRHSTEELTPLRADPYSAIPTVYLAGALLLNPRSATRFTGGVVSNYALTAQAWRNIVAADTAATA